MSNELIPIRGETLSVSKSVFSDPDKFDHWQRMGIVLSSSSMVPKHFKGKENLGNVLIVLNMSERTGVDPFLLMQNIDDIQGKMALSSKYLIAAVNDTGHFSPLRYETENRGQKSIVASVRDESGNYQKKTLVVDDLATRATATDLKSGEKLIGPWVSIEMAIAEGWYTKKGSKWPNMPEIMLNYRAASFWTSIYSPGSKLGMQTREEIMDSNYIDVTPVNNAAAELNQIGHAAEKIKPVIEIISNAAAPEPAQQQTIEIQQTEAVPTETETVEISNDKPVEEEDII